MDSKNKMDSVTGRTKRIVELALKLAQEIDKLDYLTPVSGTNIVETIAEPMTTTEAAPPPAENVWPDYTEVVQMECLEYDQSEANDPANEQEIVTLPNDNAADGVDTLLTNGEFQVVAEDKCIGSDHLDSSDHDGVGNKCNYEIDGDETVCNPGDGENPDDEVTVNHEGVQPYSVADNADNEGEIASLNVSSTSDALDGINTPNTQETEFPRGRKRVRHQDKWKCNIRKRCREAGREYTSKNGGIMSARCVKPPCTSSCKRKCSEKISSEDRQHIFNRFWREGNNNNFKRLYVASHVIAKNVARRVVQETEFRRNVTLQYYFEVHGLRLQVCKPFFLNTLSISEMYVKTALAKKSTGGIVEPDQRGKKVPPNKLDEEVREGIRNHIRMFPINESHYSREKSARQYLGSHLNISKMYSLYVEHCKENQVKQELIAKQWLYHHIFNTEFNLGFKEPANDTCDDCDEFQMKLKNSTSDEERLKIKSDYDDHLSEADKRYKSKAFDKKSSKEPGSKTKVVLFDLQKCLPTQHLSNSSMFYLRKLWTYNLTILDASEQKAYGCMWDETVAGRGPKEMSSCLLKWARDNLPDTHIEELTIWTDNCGSQNRNFPMIVSYFWILRCIPNLKVINHKFLLKGHTHMEVDGVHAVIERAKRKLSSNTVIATPWDWQQFVRQCRFKELIEVYDMQVTDFKNFEILFKGPSSPLVKRATKTVSSEKFLVSQVVHLQVRAENLGSVFYKTAFGDEFQEIDVQRRTRGAVWPEELPALRNTVRPIATEKYKDLQKLLKWVPQCFHSFYKGIPQAMSTRGENDPEGIDGDEDIIRYVY